MKKRLFPAGGLDRIARLLVRGGFFFLFLIPLLPPIYKRLTYQPAAETASWLLPWDPLLALGNLLHGNLSVVVIGAPLLLLALSLVFGRAFCGWVCPVGTLADLVRLLPVRRGKRMPKPGAGGRRNSRLRYVILGAALAGSLLSIKFLGWIDPLVIFSRAANAVGDTLLGSPQDFERGASAYFSLLLLSILLLEFWRARFWCRHLCPLGALFSLVSRWSLLNRRVSAACGNCVRCKRICPMNAIPEDAHNTDYSDCTFCLECESACPENAVSFGFGGLALGVWRPKKGEASSPKAGRSP